MSCRKPKMFYTVNAFTVYTRVFDGMEEDERTDGGMDAADAAEMPIDRAVNWFAKAGKKNAGMAKRVVINLRALNADAAEMPIDRAVNGFAKSSKKNAGMAKRVIINLGTLNAYAGNVGGWLAIAWEVACELSLVRQQRDTLSVRRGR